MVSPPDSDDGSLVLDALLHRRSVSKLIEPGPTDAELDLILQAATSVPDHGTLRPWRFVVVSGDERARFGAALRAAGIEVNPDLSEAARDKLEHKAFFAPTFIVLISSPKPGAVQRWEQEASAASAGYAMNLAAHLLGVGAMWKSASVRAGTALANLFGLSNDDLLMGWVCLGTSGGTVRERRNPPDLAVLASRLANGKIVSWDPASRR